MYAYKPSSVPAYRVKNVQDRRKVIICLALQLLSGSSVYSADEAD